MRTLLRLSVALPLVLVSSTFLRAQKTEELPRWEPMVKSVAVFKNGLGFVYKTGKTRLADGWAQTDALPGAVLGTVWLGTVGKTGSLAEVISYKEKRTSERATQSLAELLATNVGKRVVLTYVVGGSAQTVTGVILGAPDQETPPGRPPADGLSAISSWRPPVLVPSDGLLLLRLGDGDQSRVLTLAKSAVVAVEFRDPPNLRAQATSEADRAKLRVTGSSDSAEIAMAYMAKGVLWSPSYRLDITSDKLAEIQLEAVLTNEMEDMKDAEVSFVVGYPNFMFAEVITPLSLKQSIQGFLDELSGGGPTGRAGPMANVMTQAISYRPDRGAGISPASAGYSIPEPMPGETSEDLYFFRKTGVSLKKGERAQYGILSASVPYEHLYQCHLGDSLNVNELGERRGSGDQDQEPRVWHVLRLENTTNQPWTTAPAFAVKGMLPAAQDILNYTPPGAKSLLKLTVATDVRAEQSQIETSRQVVNNYDQVTVKGTFRFTNMKRESVNVLARKSLTGEVLAAPEGKVTKVARKLTAVNSTSEIEWEFPLPAGGSKELTYTYKLLIRR